VFGQVRGIEDEDWRLYNCQTIRAVNNPRPGMKIKPGDTIKSVALLDLDRKEYLLGIPHPAAVFLSASYRSHRAALSLCDQATSSLEGHNYLPDGLAFDCIEHAMAAVIFAFTSLEAFANKEIPDTHVYHEKRDGILIPLLKDDIEQRVSLSTKLDAILPDIFGVPSPKGSALWDEFVKIRKLRDRIIHMKAADTRDRVTDKNSIWRSLFRHDLPCFADGVRRMMSHFYSQPGRRPRWFEKIPH
jgi:hypothetical protein